MTTLAPADVVDHQSYYIATEIKTLRGLYRRHIRWQTYCDAACDYAHSVMLADGTEERDAAGTIVKYDSDAWWHHVEAYEANHPRPAMPSKPAKYRMYDSAYRLHRLLELTDERPHTLAEVGALVRKAEELAR